MTKTVIITGASRGIGRATAELFAAHDYNVVINYQYSKAEAEQVREQLCQRGRSAELFRADVSIRSEAVALVDYCQCRFGRVDILVNNAGVAQSKLFIDLTDQDWDRMLNINLKGVFHCCQAALQYMLPRKAGKIINISSIWGITGAACEVHYSAAKAGVIGLTKALAKELGPSNIQVNCVAPGVIRTDMLADYTDSELNELREATPLQRLGSPEDVAQTVLFLASEAADFITGQVISTNGGFVI
ncbi:3-oxoacyl-[acyl-carrier protein] reductase [Hydrogenispora ethanolica]|uniref:3-oxoacyl-[acyl-carrier protein] reductase n=1 Tax=Hydrogenispora ethanolica TaxID=1082276 RepID=A0A4R1QV86_HYDET|nr:3-oxoacyl-ACP reductase FabG [Hydrogenispora ethanolica]TCL54864.1 3-oxoacyl-[acyl-carrier protein] reductase [Hydrogenispora ethanolica]